MRARGRPSPPCPTRVCPHCLASFLLPSLTLRRRRPACLAEQLCCQGDARPQAPLQRGRLRHAPSTCSPAVRPCTYFFVSPNLFPSCSRPPAQPSSLASPRTSPPFPPTRTPPPPVPLLLPEVNDPPVNTTSTCESTRLGGRGMTRAQRKEERGEACAAAAWTRKVGK